MPRKPKAKAAQVLSPLQDRTNATTSTNTSTAKLTSPRKSNRAKTKMAPSKSNNVVVAVDMGKTTMNLESPTAAGRDPENGRRDERTIETPIKKWVDILPSDWSPSQQFMPKTEASLLNESIGTFSVSQGLLDLDLDDGVFFTRLPSLSSDTIGGLWCIDPNASFLCLENEEVIDTGDDSKESKESVVDGERQPGVPVIDSAKKELVAEDGKEDEAATITASSLSPRKPEKIPLMEQFQNIVKSADVNTPMMTRRRCLALTDDSTSVCASNKHVDPKAADENASKKLDRGVCCVTDVEDDSESEYNSAK